MNRRNTSDTNSPPPDLVGQSQTRMGLPMHRTQPVHDEPMHTRHTSRDLTHRRLHRLRRVGLAATSTRRHQIPQPAPESNPSGPRSVDSDTCR
ncbi:hypothetical protein Ae356Ps1_6257 [Pseudonocardia sp. Ae356_Ps1]|nr:hypothetical protein Ae356Ps1_6257 [Pseudonocardia sp. Ae356_Ps1]